MNYYEHHIGDYAEATAHLTFVEDAAYSRMIRKYYAQEKPLPADLKAVQRLIGARTKEEREAVETVLSEFFELDVDGWHNSRCDVEVARYLGKTEGKDTKRENERERQRRHRQRRKELFDALREHGEVPAFDTSTDDLVTALERITLRNVTQPVTRDATAIQSPVTSHQSPNIKQEASSVSPNSLAPAQAGDRDDAKPINRNVQVSVLLRARQVKPMTAMHPLAIEWADNPKITDALLLDAIEQARQYKPDGDIHPNYLRPIITEKLNPAPPRTDSEWRKSNPGIDAKGRELGMFPKGTEGYPQFADRIAEEIRKRKSDPSQGGKAA